MQHLRAENTQTHALFVLDYDIVEKPRQDAAFVIIIQSNYCYCHHNCPSLFCQHAQSQKAWGFLKDILPKQQPNLKSKSPLLFAPGVTISHDHFPDIK